MATPNALCSPPRSSSATMVCRLICGVFATKHAVQGLTEALSKTVSPGMTFRVADVFAGLIVPACRTMRCWRRHP